MNFDSSFRTAFNRRLNPKLKTKLPLIVLGVVLLTVAGISAKKIQDAGKPVDTRIEVMDAKMTKPINREFTFPLVDAKGDEVTRITYTVEAAELRDEIITQGKRASAVKGRTFLIIPIKITNNFDKALEIQSKDYMRLVVGGNDIELRAADLHSDPVTVQAISTKLSRLGFAINDTDTNVKLLIGELNGTKETIEISF